jgi:hypothetical protein
MNRHWVSIVAGLLATISADVVLACEFSADHTIVVSDAWCAPSCSGSGCFYCNTGHLIKGAKCNGPYCDNMVYTCGDPPVFGGTQVTLCGPIFRTAPTSDEDGEWSQAAVCPAYYAMVGMWAYGDYSDNIVTQCQSLSSISTDVVLTIRRATTPISEEAPNNSMAVSNWLSGASCTGSNCDNMYYWYTIATY